MFIEFHCPHCDKLLKTTADKAGVNANCPGCGEIVTVPLVTTAEPDPTRAPTESRAAAGVSRDDSDIEQTLCPMCGGSNQLHARRCRHCGEDLEFEMGEGSFSPTPVEIGPIFDKAWGLYKQNLGTCVGVGAVFLVLTTAVNNLPNALIQSLTPRRAIDPGAAAALLLPLSLISWVFNVFLTIGECRVMLKLARGQPTGIGDLFSGGRFLVVSLAVSLLYTMMTVAGTILCIVPGILLMLMFWPYQHLIVDRPVGILESLGTSHKLTTGNLGTGLLLGLLNAGLLLAGFVMCCVGLLFTVPLVMLLNAVAYLMISGQRTAPLSS